jgi:hypothetical protein
MVELFKQRSPGTLLLSLLTLLLTPIATPEDQQVAKVW